MRRSGKWTLLLGVLLALTLGVAACGGDDGGDEQGTAGGTPAEGQRGGTLIALWAGDTDNIDPGGTYYQMGTQIVRATQKTLYTPKIDDSTIAEPDLAETDPQISEDGCQVTVTLKQGVMFSPPVDREVTSADVKYAIERGFFNTVNNGYAGAYFGSLRGAEVGVDPGTEIPGIETPDDYTVVFNLEPAEGEDRCTGGVLAGALQMPLSAPVPADYAEEHDAENPSQYGQNQIATGPYMIENDASGEAIGYQPGRRIHLVRNPNWDANLDNRPAYVDEIDIRQGNDDATVMSREILDGQSMIQGDQSPPPAILKQALTRQKEQLQLVPSGGGRWVAMNMTIPPFDDVNIRKAVIAGFDREAMRLTRGGEVLGDIPTHFLPPGMAGFEEAGGLEGPGLDFLANPGGDAELAAEYFREAGYDSGQYEGDETLLMVGENEGVDARAAEVAQQQFEKLGFNVRLRQVTGDAMYTKFCNVPDAEVAICPNVGWLKDFPDPVTFLDPTFNGDNILETGNSNWSQLDAQQLNQQMNEAKLLTDPAEIAQAWGEVDTAITEQAPAVPWIWDKQANIRSENVVGVIDEDNAQWSFAHTSIRQ
ncbi:MAG: ABC transporter substrate-binding protein [Solirubrobacteraceae bacterium]